MRRGVGDGPKKFVLNLDASQSPHDKVKKLRLSKIGCLKSMGNNKLIDLRVFITKLNNEVNLK